MASVDRSYRTALYCIVLAACDGAQGGAAVDDEDVAAAVSAPSEEALAKQADDAMRSEDPGLFALASRYFPGATPASPPTRLARLTRSQLELTVQSLLADAAQSVPLAMPRDPLQTNYEYAENLSFNAANFTPYTAWVTAVAGNVAKKPSLLGSCLTARASQSCQRSAAEAFVRRGFRNIVTTQQAQRFSSFFAASVGEVGLAQASADLVSLVLTSPSFVFRDEVHTSAQDKLPASQWAQSLSYALTDAPPDAVGLTTTSANKLGDKKTREQTVAKLMGTPQAKQKLERFFLAWLEVKEPSEFTIASEVFPEFTPQLAGEMVNETRTFLKNTLNARDPSLKDITQATGSYVSAALRPVYGVSRGSSTGRTSLNPAQRLGIFTHPAVIASHSGPSTTRLVKRGVFFTRKMMCLPLGQPPQGIEALVPEGPDMTERQRIESATSAPRCQGCHEMINPFGFMQESFDPIGRFRTSDNGKPVDPSMAVDFLDEGPLAAKTSVDALRALTSSARFQQCFVRQMFRFYMGRDELEGDEPVLRQMYFRFARTGKQDIHAALRILASSALISARKEPQP